MTARVCASVLICLFTACAVHAADKAQSGEIVGTWKISADSLGGGTYQITFAQDSGVTVTMIEKSKNGDSHSSSSGPNWKRAGDKLTFNGSAQVNNLKVAGTWSLTWDGPDAVTAKADDGKTYKLTRVTEP